MCVQHESFFSSLFVVVVVVRKKEGLNYYFMVTSNVFNLTRTQPKSTALAPHVMYNEIWHKTTWTCWYNQLCWSEKWLGQSSRRIKRSWKKMLHLSSIFLYIWPFSIFFFFFLSIATLIISLQVLRADQKKGICT